MKTSQITREQLHHVQCRLHQIHDAKVKALRAEHTIPAKTITVKQYIAGIKDGSIKPCAWVKQDEVLGNSNHGAIFDLSKVCVPAKLDDKFEAKHKVLNDAYQKAMDRAILGTAPEALSALQEFEKV